MKFVFATGGTAGHINPALAVAGELRKRYPDAKFLFIGTKDHLEAKLVPAAGFDFKTIDISGFQRKLNMQNIKRNLSTVRKLSKASRKARDLLLEFQPDVVIGFGGYVSGPVLRQAVKLGIKTAIHEQNAFPGVANKTLAKSVDRVMITVKEAEPLIKAKNGCIVTGLPVRGEVARADKAEARAFLGLDDRPLILSFGGSLGARKINEAMIEVISRKYQAKDCCFIHAMGQYGLWMPDKLKENGVNLEREPHVMVKEYIHNMDCCLAAADLVICRAGASTLSELEMQGKPSILIPSPNVAENHQYHNAMALVNRNAAMILEEKDLTGEKLTQIVDQLLKNPDQLQKLGQNAKNMAITDAVDRICEVIVGLMNKETL